MCVALRTLHVCEGTYHDALRCMTIHASISRIYPRTNFYCNAGTSMLRACVLAVLVDIYCQFSALLPCFVLLCRIYGCAVSPYCIVDMSLFCRGSYVREAHYRLCGIVCLLSC